jgi:hypothetical protein
VISLFPLRVAAFAEVRLAQFGAKNTFRIIGRIGKTWVTHSLAKEFVRLFAANGAKQPPGPFQLQLVPYQLIHRHFVAAQVQEILNGRYVRGLHFV